MQNHKIFGHTWAMGLIYMILAMNFLGGVEASDATWNGTSDAIWNNPANWSATPVPGSGNTATFNNAGGALDTLDLGSGVTMGNLIFDTASAAAYTLGSGAADSQTLTLNNNGSITLNSTVTTNQTINAAIVLGTDGSTQTTTFTVPSGKWLSFKSVTGSSGSGTKTLVCNGIGNFDCPSVIANGTGGGTLALTKLGTGVLYLKAANTFSGQVKINQGTTALSNSGSMLNVTNIEIGGTTANYSSLALRTDLDCDF
jgi:autotransporter-associated beta strand protein